MNDAHSGLTAVLSVGSVGYHWPEVWVRLSLTIGQISIRCTSSIVVVAKEWRYYMLPGHRVSHLS